MAQKATRAGVKEHNRRLILRFVFSGEAVSRVKLARLTGLAKPTVSDIVSDLIEDGLLEESGRGEATESGG
jgi:Mn-dependent DtxR family transcriptional regulator